MAGGMGGVLSMERPIALQAPRNAAVGNMVWGGL